MNAVVVQREADHQRVHAEVALEGPDDRYGAAAARACANLTLVRTAVASLGGVPPMLSINDFHSDHGPDDKAVALFVAFLCSRLLEANYLSSYVDRAAERTKKGLKEEVVSELQKGEALKGAGSGGGGSVPPGPKQA